MNPLIRKLLVNALTELQQKYYNASCNDLFPDDPLLKNISLEELIEIREKWIGLCPKDADSQNNEMSYDFNIINLLQSYLQKNINYERIRTSS